MPCDAVQRRPAGRLPGSGPRRRGARPPSAPPCPPLSPGRRSARVVGRCRPRSKRRGCADIRLYFAVDHRPVRKGCQALPFGPCGTLRAADVESRGASPAGRCSGQPRARLRASLGFRLLVEAWAVSAPDHGTAQAARCRLDLEPRRACSSPIPDVRLCPGRGVRSGRTHRLCANGGCGMGARGRHRADRGLHDPRDERRAAARAVFTFRMEPSRPALFLPPGTFLRDERLPERRVVGRSAGHQLVGVGDPRVGLRASRSPEASSPLPFRRRPCSSRS